MNNEGWLAELRILSMTGPQRSIGHAFWPQSMRAGAVRTAVRSTRIQALEDDE